AVGDGALGQFGGDPGGHLLALLGAVGLDRDADHRHVGQVGGALVAGAHAVDGHVVAAAAERAHDFLHVHGGAFGAEDPDAGICADVGDAAHARFSFSLATWTGLLYSASTRVRAS